MVRNIIGFFNSGVVASAHSPDIFRRYEADAFWERAQIGETGP